MDQNLTLKPKLNGSHKLTCKNSNTSGFHDNFTHAMYKCMLLKKLNPASIDFLYELGAKNCLHIIDSILIFASSSILNMCLVSKLWYSYVKNSRIYIKKKQIFRKKIRSNLLNKENKFMNMNHQPPTTILLYNNNSLPLSEIQNYATISPKKVIIGKDSLKKTHHQTPSKCPKCHYLIKDKLVSKCRLDEHGCIYITCTQCNYKFKCKIEEFSRLSNCTSYIRNNFLHLAPTIINSPKSSSNIIGSKRSHKNLTRLL